MYCDLPRAHIGQVRRFDGIYCVRMGESENETEQIKMPDGKVQPPGRTRHSEFYSRFHGHLSTVHSGLT